MKFRNVPVLASAALWFVVAPLVDAAQGAGSGSGSNTGGQKSASEAGNAAMNKTWASWNTPVKPFRIIGNIHYRTLNALPCDVFLAPHAGFFGLMEKFERLQKGEKTNPFIDPQEFRAFIGRAERNFLRQLEQEQGGR